MIADEKYSRISMSIYPKTFLKALENVRPLISSCLCWLDPIKSYRIPFTSTASHEIYSCFSEAWDDGSQLLSMQVYPCFVCGLGVTCRKLAKQYGKANEMLFTLWVFLQERGVSLLKPNLVAKRLGFGRVSSSCISTLSPN